MLYFNWSPKEGSVHEKGKLGENRGRKALEPKVIMTMAVSYQGTGKDIFLIQYR